MSAKITCKTHVMEVCKLGKGSTCCRFLSFSHGFCCEKKSDIAGLLNARANAGTMRALGDNCSGAPDFVPQQVNAEVSNER